MILFHNNTILLLLFLIKLEILLATSSRSDMHYNGTSLIQTLCYEISSIIRTLPDWVPKVALVYKATSERGHLFDTSTCPNVAVHNGEVPLYLQLTCNYHTFSSRRECSTPWRGWHHCRNGGRWTGSRHCFSNNPHSISNMFNI